MEKKNETEGEKRGGDTCMKFGQNMCRGWSKKHVSRLVKKKKKKKKKSYTSPTFQAEAGTLVRVTADITAAT